VSPARVSRPALAFPLALVLLAGERVSADPLPFEIAFSAREAGHLRGLFEKLSKQNVLYHFHLADTTKQDLQETTAEIDRVIASLEKGSPAYSIAPPVTPEIGEQIRVVDRAWGRLRALALASPYDYLRHGSDLLPKRNRLGDPFSIQTFDDLARDSISAADSLQQLVLVECRRTGFEFCDAAAQAGFFNMHVERIAKELVLVFAGIEEEQHLADMRGNVDRLDERLEALGASPIVTGAIAPSRGRSATFVTALWASIQDGWSKVRFEADLALEGRPAEIDIQRMLKAQRELVDDFDRFRAALSRFAEAQGET
jgi:hypothetical protein